MTLFTYRVDLAYTSTDGEEISESGLDFDVDAGADVEIQDAGFFNPSDDFEDGDDSSVTSSDSTTA